MALGADIHPSEALQMSGPQSRSRATLQTVGHTADLGSAMATPLSPLVNVRFWPQQHMIHSVDWMHRRLDIRFVPRCLKSIFMNCCLIGSLVRC